VRWDRVVDQGADPGPGQTFLQPVAIARAYDVKVPGRIGPVGNMRQDQIAAAQAFGVGRCNRAAAIGPGIEMRQLGPQDGSLDRVEARIHALHLVHVFHPAAIVAQHADAVGQIGAVRGDRTAIAQGAQVLAGIEAPAHHIAMRADAAPLVARAMGLGGILDHRKAVLTRQRKDRVKVGRLAVEVNRQDRLCRRSNGGGDAGGIDVVGGGVGFHRDGPRADSRDRQPGGDIGVRRHDHLVPRPDVERPEREDQRIKAVGDPHRMIGAAPGRPVGLERVHLGSEDVPARVEDTVDGRVDLGLEFAVGGAEVEEGNVHARRLSSSARKSS